MKALFALILLSVVQLTCAQTAHVIRGLDFYYSPDTVYMQVGDSVDFQTQSIHDMVQTDSASWAINQAISNGGFVTNIGADTTFAIDTAGVYYFVCSPHGFVGMKGVLIVDTAIVTGISPNHSRQSNKVDLKSNGRELTIRSSGQVPTILRITDMRGSVCYANTLPAYGTERIGSDGWSAGVYILTAHTQDGKRPERIRFVLQ
jgi:plastocyanin